MGKPLHSKGPGKTVKNLDSLFFLKYIVLKKKRKTPEVAKMSYRNVSKSALNLLQQKNSVTFSRLLT